MKKAQRDIEGEPSGFSDEEEFDGSRKSGRTAEEKLERSLFGENEGIIYDLVVHSCSSHCLLDSLCICVVD